MEQRINNAIKECIKEQNKKGANPYLPVIIESLETMKSIVISKKHDSQQCSKIATGLFRIMTENGLSSIESDLVESLLNIANDFMKGKF